MFIAKPYIYYISFQKPMMFTQTLSLRHEVDIPVTNHAIWDLGTANFLRGHRSFRLFRTKLRMSDHVIYVDPIWRESCSSKSRNKQ